MKCCICNETGTRGTMQEEVRGFAPNRRQGGANKIELREPTGRWAHENCIRLQKLGITSAQGTLA